MFCLLRENSIIFVSDFFLMSPTYGEIYFVFLHLNLFPTDGKIYMIGKLSCFDIIFWEKSRSSLKALKVYYWVKL